MQDGQHYRPSDFYDPIILWFQVGAPLHARGGIMDVLSRPMTFASTALPEAMTLSCKMSMLAIALANRLLTGGRGEDPWPLFASVPWEDMARGRWPIFELASILGEREAEALARNESEAARALFWRTCPSEEAAALWHRPEVRLAGRALQTAALHSGPDVSAALARAGAIALLKFLDVSSMVYQPGFCSVLPWAAVAHGLAISQGQASLVSPGYPLRLLQSMFQDAYRDDPEQFIWDVIAAPWPVLTALAELASAELVAHPVLETLQVQSSGDAIAAAPDSPPAAAFRPTDPGRLRQLMDTMRVAHAFLASIGADYFAIAGTLLGAVRHMGVIPWDDDIDLCVDGGFEPRLFALVLAEESSRLGLGWQRGLDWRGRRALSYLRREGYSLKVQAARSLTFRIVRTGPDGGGDAAAPSVDIWLCWHSSPNEKEDKETGGDAVTDAIQSEVTLMSKKYGPSVPWASVYPRQKLPFGDLTVWCPAEPVEVTRRYLVHGGWSEDFMGICEGQKVHGSAGNSEYNASVACQSLPGSFAGPWLPLAPGDNLTEEAVQVLEDLLKERLPGWSLAPTAQLTIESATLGGSLAPRVRLAGWIATGAGPSAAAPVARSGALAGQQREVQRLWCRALLWRSESPEDDLLTPGAHAATGQVLRSLTCGQPSAEPSYVWEDPWT